MHYVIKIPSNPDVAYCVESPGPAKSLRPGMFNRGLPVKEKLPPLSVTTDEDHGSRFLDAIPNQGLLFVISKKLLDILNSLKLANIEAFPIIVKDYDSKRKHDYWVCNVVGLIPCLDRRRADVVWEDDDPQTIFLLRKMALDELLIEAANKGRKAQECLKLFRLKEAPQFLIASEEIRKAVLEAGITGIEFRKPEEAGDLL